MHIVPCTSAGNLSCKPCFVPYKQLLTSYNCTARTTIILISIHGTYLRSLGQRLKDLVPRRNSLLYSDQRHVGNPAFFQRITETFTVSRMFCSLQRIRRLSPIFRNGTLPRIRWHAVLARCPESYGDPSFTWRAFPLMSYVPSSANSIHGEMSISTRLACQVPRLIGISWLRLLHVRIIHCIH